MIKKVLMTLVNMMMKRKIKTKSFTLKSNNLFKILMLTLLLDFYI